MPQFCILFYANYTTLATQKGGHGPMPPPKYAPANTNFSIRNGIDPMEDPYREITLPGTNKFILSDCLKYSA